jgi:hypothetical protein
MSMPLWPCFLNVHDRPHLADALHRLALILQEVGLRVERVHLAHAAVAEDRDDRLRPRREMLWLRREGVLLGQKAISAEEVGEGEARDAAAQP